MLMIKTLIKSATISAFGLAMIGGQAFASNNAATSINVTGNDISYPQCHSKLPSGQAFAIVGVNDGLANNFNPCLSTQLSWAASSTGVTAQPKVALYVNTGNPGDVTPTVADWPKANDPTIANPPYGTCDGSDNAACSWQYGYERANADIASVKANSRLWWLDVETANSWTTSQANNRADLEGMVYALESANPGNTVGVYATSAQWAQIIGTVASSDSSLYNLVEWLPGASSEAAAKTNCALPPLTGGGKVSVSQYTSNALDYDWSCLQSSPTTNVPHVMLPYASISNHN